jgi:hypothetical protein
MYGRGYSVPSIVKDRSIEWRNSLMSQESLYLFYRDCGFFIWVLGHFDENKTEIWPNFKLRDFPFIYRWITKWLDGMTNAIEEIKL